METLVILYLHPHAQESHQPLPWKPFVFYRATKFVFEDNFCFCFSGVPMYDLAPMKNCPGGAK